MGKSSQRKGKTGELELAAILQAEGYAVERGASMTFGEVPDLSGLPGVHIECKRVEKLNLSEAMQQATRDAQRFGDGEPAVFHRRNRSPWVVSMPLTSWLKLYKAVFPAQKRVETRKEGRVDR